MRKNEFATEVLSRTLQRSPDPLVE